MLNFRYSKKKLPTRYRIYPEQKKLVHRITKETFPTKKIYLKNTGENSQFISVIFVKDLIQYISSLVEGLEKQKKLRFENFDYNLWLLFWRDKERRKAHKISFSRISFSNAGSVYSVHIFVMYEGSDSHSNMALVLPLQSQEIFLSGVRLRYF